MDFSPETKAAITDVADDIRVERQAALHLVARLVDDGLLVLRPAGRLAPEAEARVQLAALSDSYADGLPEPEDDTPDAAIAAMPDGS